MDLKLYAQPDAETLESALAIYRDAFAAEGRKPDAILKRMFEKSLSLLAVAGQKEAPDAMAICGVLDKPGLLLIDYLAVRAARRGQGLGSQIVEELARLAQERGLRGLLIEAEADATPENEARLRFWEKNGFVRTAYVHQYIWVPEPYLAMLRLFAPGKESLPDGKELFVYISEFHRRSFR